MIKKKRTGGKLLTYLALILLALVTLIPLAWLISCSFKPNSEIYEFPIHWIPRRISWKNYTKVWTDLPLGTYLLNTVKLTVIITMIQLFTCSFAAYGFAKCKFPGRDKLFTVYLATMAIPWQSYMLAQYIEMSKFGLINTHLSIILMQAFSVFGVFLMRQFYMSIPDELLEAARIDGLSEFGIYTRIMLPLSKPALATLTIFTAVKTWNDYMGPYIYLTDEKLKTLQVGIKSFVGQYTTNYGSILAATLLSMIPMMIIYIAFQRFFVEGIASTGVKG